MLVISVINQALYMLDGSDSIRWPKETLLKWFNEAQLALVNRRPDALALTAPFACVEGALQTLPSDGIHLVEVVRNLGASQSAISEVNRKKLDTNIRDWYGLTPVTQIEHFIYDPKVPKSFYVYPPAAAGASIELAYTISPTVVDIANIDTAELQVDDTWANALQEYILYRAWTKDSEDAANMNRAASHFSQFRLAIGEITEAQMAVAAA